MSIKTDAGRGISLRLAANAPSRQTDRVAGGYYKVRLTQGGDEFFSHENSQLILQYLGEFLPRAVEGIAEDGSPELFYQFLLDGKDICGESSQLKAGNELPAVEIDRLNMAIAAMKAKEADPETDPTKRKAISCFRLPSPQKDPELYRVCSIRGKKRLLVLWGVEKELGSSVAPQDAVSTVVAGVAGGGTKNSKGIPAFVWLLILLCMVAGLYGYSKLKSGGQGEKLPIVAVDPKTVGPIGVVDPKTGMPIVAVDPKTGEPIVAVDPETGMLIAAVDPKTGEPVAAVDPKTGKPVPSVDSKTGESVASVSPTAEEGPTANEGETAMPVAAGDSQAGESASPADPKAGMDLTDSAETSSALMVIPGQLELPVSETAPLAQPRIAAPNEVGTAKLIRPAVVTIAAGTKEDGLTGQGTGFLISSSGLVVTNAHVIRGMDQLVAITADGRTLAVTKVLISDDRRDLALLTLEDQKASFPFLKLGEANSAVVGGDIAVMGTPQGLSSTFTTGIVSAMREEDTVALVQITAPVSPGSSGSPVVDDNALVVGIVRGGVDMALAQALNFAIDVGELHELLAELLSKGTKVDREALGQVDKGEPINTKDAEDLPPESATAKAPEYPVTWKPEQALPGADPTPRPDVPPGSQPAAAQPPAKIEAIAGRIQVTEVRRKLITDQEMEIELQVLLRTVGSTFESVTGLRCESAGKALKVSGDKVHLLAGKGTNQLRVSGKDSEGSPVMADIDINVMFEITSDVEIKEK